MAGLSTKEGASRQLKATAETHTCTHKNTYAYIKMKSDVQIYKREYICKEKGNKKGKKMKINI